jgi:hypothetical protein
MSLWVHSHAPSIRSHRGIKVVWPDFQPMRVPEEPVCVHLFRQKPVFTSLHLKSPVHVHRLRKPSLSGDSRTRREIIYCKRAILSISSSKILTPHPPFPPASVYPRLCWGGGGGGWHTRHRGRLITWNQFLGPLNFKNSGRHQGMWANTKQKRQLFSFSCTNLRFLRMLKPKRCVVFSQRGSHVAKLSFFSCGKFTTYSTWNITRINTLHVNAARNVNTIILYLTFSRSFFNLLENCVYISESMRQKTVRCFYVIYLTF